MEPRYEKSLDGFRTIAVLLVIIHHWLPMISKPTYLSLGMIGVTMFFTLSGFLITGILLRNKESGLKAGTIFRNFYIRRSLRIFPVYYLFIFVLFFLGCFHSLAYFISCLTYTSNFYIASVNKWQAFAGHTWSLAVEEQFYLIWPFVLLFCKINTRNLLLFFVGLGIVSRIIFALFCSADSLHAVLTPNCFDCFALGGLLAYYTRTYSEEQKRNLTYKLNIAAVISLACYVGEVVFNSPVLQITERLYISLISAATINVLFNVQTSVLKTALSFSPIVYMGKISYAIYLFHGDSITLYNYLQKQTDIYHLYIPFTHYTLLPWVGGNKQMVLYFGFLILMCSLSWYMIEKPINSLKKNFT